MKRITYFTGAGSSYHSLPLIKTMNGRLKAYSEYLKILRDSNKIDLEKINYFIKELDSLITECEASNSIDSYAKELFNGNQPMKLHRLKIILSSYLIFEQLKEYDGTEIPLNKLADRNVNPDTIQQLKTNVDRRYRSFWANYTQPNSITPMPNIKVISWNYDMQFELSYSLAYQCSLELAQQNLQVYPSPIYEVFTDNFCLIKLNGSAGLYKDTPFKKLENLFDLKEHQLDIFNINLYIDILFKNKMRAFFTPIFSFAWENEEENIKSREYASKTISESDTIVIIGYSFPPFNKEVDKELFSNWDQSKKLYLQAGDDIESIKYRMNGVKPGLGDSVHEITDLYEFHIPNEI